MPLLDAGEKRSSQWLREFNLGKVALRIQIVFARLINYANLIVLRGIRVGEELVDLPALERHLVTFIAKAYHKLSSSSCHI
jgi:hypothetical protein